MKYASRLLLIAAVVATVFVFASPRPASAAACSLVTSGFVSPFNLTGVTVPAGHTYRIVTDSPFLGTQTVSGPNFYGVIAFSTGVHYSVYDVSGGCTVPGEAVQEGVTFYTPGDSRVDPLPGDRLVVYCNTGATPPTLDVWGVTNDSKGHRLYTLAYNDLLKAGAKGLLKKVEPLGSVSAVVDAHNNFAVKWFGGPASATGTGDFAKAFSCDFAQ